MFELVANISYENPGEHAILYLYDPCFPPCTDLDRKPCDTWRDALASIPAKSAADAALKIRNRDRTDAASNEASQSVTAPHAAFAAARPISRSMAIINSFNRGTQLYICGR
jgi:hypothetical protein